MEKKKERSVNFTAREVEILCELVVKYKSVLECKKTDAVTWKLKEEYWNKLTTIFNSRTTGPPRTVKSLKTKYDTFKKDLRKKISKNKIELYKTGGGTFKEIPLTPCEESIYGVIGFSIEGMPSEMDSDSVQKSSNIIQLPEEEETECEPREQITTIVNEDDDSLFSFEVVQQEKEFIEFNRSPDGQNGEEVKQLDMLLFQEIYKQPKRKMQRPNYKLLKKLLCFLHQKKKLIDVQIKYYEAEFEFKEKENRLKLRKAEIELRKEEIDVEIKLLDKKIKEETLKKLLQNTFNI